MSRTKTGRVVLGAVAVVALFLAGLGGYTLRGTQGHVPVRSLSCVPASPSATPDWENILTAPASLVAPPGALFDSVRSQGGDLTKWADVSTSVCTDYWTNDAGTPVLVQMDARRGMDDNHPGILMCVVPTRATPTDIRKAIGGVDSTVIGAKQLGAIVTMPFGDRSMTCQAVVVTINTYNGTGESSVQ